MLKKLFLPLVLILSLTGCAAKEYSWVVKIQGQEISPEEYVSAQMQAYVEARNRAEYSSSVLGGTIDGISTEQWINDHTIQQLQRKIYIENEFSQRNLKFGTEADEFIRIFGEEGWENVSDLYEKNNLEFEYYLEYLKSLYKEQLVFNSIFLYGENSKVTDQEIEEYLANNISRVSLFKVARVNDDGTPADAVQAAQLDAMVSDAVARINNGEKMLDVAGDVLTQSGVLLGSDVDFSDPSDYIATEYITSSNIALVFDFMENFFLLEEGKCVSYRLEDCYYICQKIRLCDTQVEYMYMKQDVVNFIRDAEFEEMIASACNEMAVEYNTEAMKVYTPQKLKMTI